MATRSLIGKILPEGGIRFIYCHWDGYPENNGVILQNHFTDEAKIDKLLDLGDVSSLAPELGDEPHDFSNPPQGVCNFYGRDRQETGCESQQVGTLGMYMRRADKCGAEYVYIWTDGKWHYSRVTTSAEMANFATLE